MQEAVNESLKLIADVRQRLSNIRDEDELHQILMILDKTLEVLSKAQ